MHATILDLRYKMKNVLKALERNEPVHILYHGKEKGTIFPAGNQGVKPSEHPAFGIWRNHRESVNAVMDRLRGGRFN